MPRRSVRMVGNSQIVQNVVMGNLGGLVMGSVPVPIEVALPERRRTRKQVLGTAAFLSQTHVNQTRTHQFLRGLIARPKLLDEME
jgi:uncharacterized membrane protein YagU involved in acid resistance